MNSYGAGRVTCGFDEVFGQTDHLDQLWLLGQLELNVQSFHNPRLFGFVYRQLDHQWHRVGEGGYLDQGSAHR